jgi:hypothetical protein
MRNLITAVSLGVMIAVPTAHAQEVEFRPAIDAIGEAYAPASESGAAIPDGADFGSVYVRSRRGKVTIESGPIPAAGAHTVHRRTWVISR